MYLLINSDSTVNYGNDHPIDPTLVFEGLELIEFPDKTLTEVVGNVKPHEAFWDKTTKSVVRDPEIIRSEELGEKVWRNKEIQTVLAKMDQYEREIGRASCRERVCLYV